MKTVAFVDINKTDGERGVIARAFLKEEGWEIQFNDGWFYGPEDLQSILKVLDEVEDSE